MSRRPDFRRGARAAAGVLVVTVLAVSGARAAGGPGQPAFEAMMKARQAGRLDDALKAAEIDRSGIRGPVELAAFYASERRWTDARELQKLKG
jgi:hypothetical protein